MNTQCLTLMMLLPMKLPELPIPASTPFEQAVESSGAEGGRKRRGMGATQREVRGTGLRGKAARVGEKMCFELTEIADAEAAARRRHFACGRRKKRAGHRRHQADHAADTEISADVIETAAESHYGSSHLPPQHCVREGWVLLMKGAMEAQPVADIEPWLRKLMRRQRDRR